MCPVTDAGHDAVMDTNHDLQTIALAAAMDDDAWATAARIQKRREDLGLPQVPLAQLVRVATMASRLRRIVEGR